MEYKKIFWAKPIGDKNSFQSYVVLPWQRMLPRLYYKVDNFVAEVAAEQGLKASPTT